MENKIIVFYDYNCPFCYIGFNIIEELKKEYKINCIYKGCELYPQIDVTGLTKEECMKGYDVESIYRKLRIMGKKNNIEFGSLDTKFNSHKALLLGEYAQTYNKIIEYSREIYKEYYLLDKDISDDGVLFSIYNKLGLDYYKGVEYINSGSLESQLIENINLKSLLNIDLLPAYIINDENIISGIPTKRAFLKYLK